MKLLLKEGGARCYKDEVNRRELLAKLRIVLFSVSESEENMEEEVWKGLKKDLNRLVGKLR